MRATGRWAAALLAAVAGLTACSNSQPPINRVPRSGTTTATSTNADGGQAVTLEVGSDDRFHPSTVVVHEGRVTITLQHDETGAPHDFQIVRFPSDYVPVVSQGGSMSATFHTPPPGRYEFICRIHLAQGMRGTLVVEPR